jgi:hypothetical protein
VLIGEEVIMNSRKDNMLNVMAMGQRIILPILLLVVMGCAGVSTVKDFNPEEDSFVIGRVKDRMIITKEELLSFQYYGDDWKIDEFELLKVGSDKATKIRMTQDGYFVRKVDPGEFVFQLNMSGSNYVRSSREVGARKLKSFTVPHKKIINIGTFAVKTNRGEGVPLNQVRFSVQPVYDSESFSDPLSWFESKNPDICDAYGDRIVSSD